MAELKFETGIVTFTVNGGYDISFNPADPVFAEKLFSTFEELDKRKDAYEAEAKKNANKKEIFELARKLDAEMRELIDGVFGEPVCNGIFGGMSTYAIADGLPVWANFMLAVVEQVDTTFAREQKATNPRISKYTAKYHK